ncbi:WG repeat-containing protein [Variovorax sp. RCC_210]|uniref:WG repeat-containing protein n=1 Tax=Variovorax sp. RCC_210 TaxID=3239217 RepID=UPI003525A9D4
MGNRSWLYFEHGNHDEQASADEIADANNNFPVLWQILLAGGDAGDAIDRQRVFGDAGTDNLASDAHAALARIRQLHAFVERHPMLHTLPQVALQFEALALHLAELIDQAPPHSSPRISANLDELSWLGGESEAESFIERQRRACNERWAEVRRCIDSGNHPGVDAALGVKRFADWETWAWHVGFSGISHAYFDGYEPPREERFADFEEEEPEESDDGLDYDDHLAGDLWRFEVDGRWGVMRVPQDDDNDDNGDNDGNSDRSRRITVVEPAWDDIRHAGANDPRLLWISLAGRSGLLLADADAPRVLLEPQLDEDWNFEDDIATALVGDHIGLLRTDGSWLLAPSVDEVWSFAEGMVRARVGERIGYVDLQGQWAIAPRFAEAEDFAPCGLAPARLEEEGGWGLVRADGEWALPPGFDLLQWRHDWEAFEATRGGKTGLLDAQGRVAIEPVYTQIELLGEYPVELLQSDDERDAAKDREPQAPRPKRFAVERAEGECGLVDALGRVLVPFDYGLFETLEPLTGEERVHAMVARDLVRVASKDGRKAKNAPWLRGIYDVAAGRELVPCEHRTLLPLTWGTQDIGWLVAQPLARSAKATKGQLAVGILRADGTTLHPQAYPWIATPVSVSDGWYSVVVRSELRKRWSAGEPVKAARNDRDVYVWLHADGREQPHTEHMAARHAAGDMKAAYELACHLRDGEGVDADPREALRWMARAAGVREPGDAPTAASPEGLPEAMRELATMLRRDAADGAGTADMGADAVMARAWLLHAVANGGADDAATQAQLGFALCEGVGGERDRAAGMRHYALAAERNSAMALFNLGIAHKVGEHDESGEPDLPSAIDYFRRAEAAGDADATLQLGGTLRAHALALAEQGHAHQEVNALHAEALYALQKLAEDDDKRLQGWACYELGLMRFRGQGAPRDADAAERWLLTGAALDDCDDNRESQGPCVEALAEELYGDPDSPLFDEAKARAWTQRLHALSGATTSGAPE